MSARRARSGWVALACALGLVLSSCALFKPERVEVASKVSKTLPPQPIAAEDSADARAQTPGAATEPRTIFIPGKPGTGGKPNYASDAGVDAGVIRLGTIQPMDGPAAQVGKPLYKATQAYVNAVNARGGINGRKLELYLQTACLNCQAENLLAAKALVEQKKVFAIVNTYMNTYAFDAAIKYLNEKRVPLIEGWSGVGDVKTSWGAAQTPWSVYYTIRNDDAVAIYANWLDAVLEEWQKAGRLPNPQNAKWVATVALDVSQDRKRSAVFKQMWEARGPAYKVVDEEYVAAEEETVTRMDSFIAKMRDADANGVFSASNITMLFGMQAAQRQSWKVPWVAKSAWGRALTDNCGTPCEGGYTDNNGWGWPELLTPQMQQYMQAMRAYYPDGAKFADAQTLGGWIGMMAFEYAAAQLGADLTRKGLIDILGNLRNFDTGVGSVINTSPSDHLGMGEAYMLQVCNKRFVRVSELLSANGPAKRINAKGDCGWGW